MNKIEEALKKLLPAEQVQEVLQAIQEQIDEGNSQLDAKYQANLNQAFEEAQKDIDETATTAYRGFEQAWAMIEDLQLRLEKMNEEWESAQDENHEEAWELLQAEMAKNNGIEEKVYQEANEKIRQVQEMFIEKIDEFMQVERQEIFEDAIRHIMSDPRRVEERVALEEIAQTAAKYLSHSDNFEAVSSKKLEETYKALEDLRANMRVLEQRNVRLSTQNTRLNDKVALQEAALNESTKVERKERANGAKNVSGRGQRVLGKEQVIAEYRAPQTSQQTDDETLVEGIEVLDDTLYLAGIEEPK